MSAVDFKEVGWILMLVPFGIVLGTGIFFVACALQRATLRRPLASAPVIDITRSDPVMPLAFASRPSWIEHPPRWLAVKGTNPGAVEAALDLHHAHTCSWEEGLVEAREDKLFICPPISGWILAVGTGLPDPSEDIDQCYHFLAALSRKLGHVQFFHSSRVLNHHAWVLIERGRVFRAYAWAGETLWNQGQPTAAEKDLDMRCLDYGVSADIFSCRDAIVLNCDKVNQLAARWSLDPSAIPETIWNAHGIVGELSHSKPH